MTPDEYNRRLLSYFDLLNKLLPELKEEQAKNKDNVKIAKVILNIENNISLNEYCCCTALEFHEYYIECRKPPKMIPNMQWKGMRMDQDRTGIDQASRKFYESAGVHISQIHQPIFFSPFLIDVSLFSNKIINTIQKTLEVTLNESPVITYQGYGKVQNDFKCCPTPSPLTSGDTVTCTNCGTIFENTKLLSSSFPEMGRIDKNNYKYNRKGWFEQRISRIQGHLVSNIPPKMWLATYEEITRGVIDRTKISITDVMRALKDLKFKKFYKDSAIIWSVVTGNKLPKIPLAAIQTIREDILTPIDQGYNSMLQKVMEERSNFYSNPFLLYKMMELIGMYEVLPFIVQLSGAPNLENCSTMWFEQCKKSGFKFYPTHSSG